MKEDDDAAGDGTHLHFVPMPVMQFSADCDDICTAAKIVSQPYRSFDQFNFEKIENATIIGVQYQAIGLFGFEFKF